MRGHRGGGFGKAAVVLLFVAGGLAFGVPGRLQAASHVAASGPFVKRVLFFHQMNDKCKTFGAPTTVFHSTDKYVNVFVRYGNWHGVHSDPYRWISPTGKVSRFATDKGRNLVSACDWIGIAGHHRSHVYGVWTFEVFLDGRLAKVSHFTLMP